MKHFLDINTLSKEKIFSLVSRAHHFKADPHYPVFNTHAMASLFYENSTRTRMSFELAASHLSLKAFSLSGNISSEAKGETVLDTVKTLRAMGMNLFVIRHREEGLPAYIAHSLDEEAHVINAGDGTSAHPTQAMLDFMTILEKKPRVDALKIAILGDVRHSRVANSLIALFERVGISELRLVTPPHLGPKEALFGKVTHSLEEGLKDVDVVICLRVQFERFAENEHFDRAIYRRDYALTEKTLSYARPDAIVMHPGPCNRELEIDSAIVDGPRSCILEQVRNGVFMRMAIIESLLKRS